MHVHRGAHSHSGALVAAGFPVILELLLIVSAERPPASSDRQRLSISDPGSHSRHSTFPPSVDLSRAAGAKALQVTSGVALVALTSPTALHEKVSEQVPEAPQQEPASTAHDAPQPEPASTSHEKQPEQVHDAPQQEPAPIAHDAPQHTSDSTAQDASSTPPVLVEGQGESVDPAESVKAMDEDKVIELVPEMKDFRAALVKGFSSEEGSYCLAVDGGDLKYGCAWMPEVRSNMSIKEKDQPACGCQFSWMFQQCWKPDADSFLTAFDGGQIETATEIAKAFMAGRCYIPIFTYVIIGTIVVLLVCGGSWKCRKKDDPRLAGSTADPRYQET